VIVGEYYLPHLAHVSMEPPVAVADVKGDKVEVWAPVQSPGRDARGSRQDARDSRGQRERSMSRCSAVVSGARVEMRLRAGSRAIVQGVGRAR